MIAKTPVRDPQPGGGLTGPCSDVDHIPRREADGLLRDGKLSVTQARKAIHRVNDRCRSLDVLTEVELTTLKGLRDRLSGIISDTDIRHFCHGIGTTVTWYDRRVDDPAEDGAR